VRTWARDPVGALKAFDAVELPAGHPTLDLAAAMARAYALGQAERSEEAVEVLAAALDAAPKPLPPLEPLSVGGSPYTPVEAARLATKALDEQLEGGAPLAAWDRLLALAPRSFDAALDATRALVGRGNRVDAVRFWKAAAALDPARAQEMAAQNEDLRRLQDFLNTPPDR
jgi:tetratricopeptide (TPR) repeat protein